MNVLLVYPAFPITYTGLQYALPITGRKAWMPPLGLITIAAMLPAECQPRLVDLNCEALTDDAIAWADVVFLSAMVNQRSNLFRAAERCRAFRKPVVMGGPFPTACPDECVPWCDTLVLGEAESIWESFADDLVHRRLQARYESNDKPDVTRTPVPRFDLLNIHDYLVLPVQFSRGCPFQCEFCDIIVMFGRRPRTKTPEQMIRELEAVKQTGHRGEIFLVDDNFIGNRKAVKEFLPFLAKWNDGNRSPYDFSTEASVDLADDDELLQQMVASGFVWVFLGIETPSAESLLETLKFQNLRESLEVSVARILASGLHVAAGFILGFDSDTDDIFDRQIGFIRSATIPFAMVGLLYALHGTPLYERLRVSGRLHESPAEDGHFGYTNIRTVMPQRTLLEGYRRVVDTIYDPDDYFERAYQSLLRLRRPASLREGALKVLAEIRRIFESMPRGDGTRGFAAFTKRQALLTGAPRVFRKAARRFLWRVVRTRPDQLYMAMKLLIFGYHVHMFTVERVLPEVDAQLAMPLRQAAQHPQPAA
jgi:radical SAM superfamily enzyme YgiQ (UPF0313 family)